MSITLKDALKGSTIKSPLSFNQDELDKFCADHDLRMFGTPSADMNYSYYIAKNNAIVTFTKFSLTGAGYRLVNIITDKVTNITSLDEVDELLKSKFDVDYKLIVDTIFTDRNYRYFPRNDKEYFSFQSITAAVEDCFRNNNAVYSGLAEYILNKAWEQVSACSDITDIVAGDIYVRKYDESITDKSYCEDFLKVLYVSGPDIVMQDITQPAVTTFNTFRGTFHDNFEVATDFINDVMSILRRMLALYLDMDFIKGILSKEINEPKCIDDIYRRGELFYVFSDKIILYFVNSRYVWNVNRDYHNEESLSNFKHVRNTHFTLLNDVVSGNLKRRGLTQSEVKDLLSCDFAEAFKLIRSTRDIVGIKQLYSLENEVEQSFTYLTDNIDLLFKRVTG